MNKILASSSWGSRMSERFVCATELFIPIELTTQCFLSALPFHAFSPFGAVTQHKPRKFRPPDAFAYWLLLSIRRCRWQELSREHKVWNFSALNSSWFNHKINIYLLHAYPSMKAFRSGVCAFLLGEEAREDFFHHERNLIWKDYEIRWMALNNGSEE